MKLPHYTNFGPLISTYITVGANSANWSSVYTTVNTYSGTWSTGIQDLSFDENTAQLSIANGNTISLSALSSLPVNLTPYALASDFVHLSGDTMTGALSAPALSADLVTAPVFYGIAGNTIEGYTGGTPGSIRINGADGNFNEPVNGCNGGNIDLTGGGEYGSIITNPAGNNWNLRIQGKINTSNFVDPEQGSLGNVDPGVGGYICTAGQDSSHGGYIDTSANGSDPGGSINTSQGGGSIDTRDKGQIQFGNDGTRTALQGTASSNRSINLPDASGTLALASDFVHLSGDTMTGALSTPALSSDYIVTTGDIFINGNAGIGTNSPSEKLDIVGNIKASGQFSFQNGDYYSSTDGVGNFLTLQNANYYQLNFVNTGVNGAGDWHVGNYIPFGIFGWYNVALGRSMFDLKDGTQDGHPIGVYFYDRVSINAGAPAAQLHVKGSSNDVNVPIAIIESDGAQAPYTFRLNTDNGPTDVAYVKGDSYGNLAFGAQNFIAFEAGGFGAGAEAMRITADKNVGIGTSTPITELDVNGIITATGGNSNLWNGSYTNVQTNSAYWADTRYDVTFGQNVTINGNLTALGTSTFKNTIFTTTSALSVINTGPGPALYVFQAAGPSDVASFYDGDGVEVLHVGNANTGQGGKVGINESFPGAELTVNGAISSNSSVSVVSVQASNSLGVGTYAPLYFNLDVNGAIGNGTIGSSYGNLGLGASGDILINPNNNLLLGPVGNVGIGTNAPAEKLTVSGNVSAGGVITATGGDSNKWNSAYNNIPKYDSSYTTTNTNSARWSDVWTTVNSNSATYSGTTRQYDYVQVGLNSYSYCGFASVGTATSSAGWTINRLYFSTAGTLLSSGAVANVIWNNRYSYTY